MRLPRLRRQVFGLQLAQDGQVLVEEEEAAASFHHHTLEVEQTKMVEQKHLAIVNLKVEENVDIQDQPLTGGLSRSSLSLSE